MQKSKLLLRSCLGTQQGLPDTISDHIGLSHEVHSAESTYSQFFSVGPCRAVGASHVHQVCGTAL